MGHCTLPEAPAGAHDHSAPAAPASCTAEHAAMGHCTLPEAPTGSHGHDAPAASAGCTPEHAAMGHCRMPAPRAPRTPIPMPTEADFAAAFPALHHHSMEHASPVNSMVVFDRIEAWDAAHGTGQAWEAVAWLGTDLDRLWLRSEGERAGGSTESADVEVLYGRAIARWWDAVAGVRHDFAFGGGPSRTYAALGVIGLAPYKFEVSATAYLGESGQLGVGAEAEYEMLFTNRLIGQWLVEGEAWSKDDPAVGIGSGLSKVEAGFRLRYEFHRQFAPYVGVVWERAYGGTADLRRAASGDVDDTRIVAGVRIWF